MNCVCAHNNNISGIWCKPKPTTDSIRQNENLNRQHEICGLFERHTNNIRYFVEASPSTESFCLPRMTIWINSLKSVVCLCDTHTKKQTNTQRIRHLVETEFNYRFLLSIQNEKLDRSH